MNQWIKMTVAGIVGGLVVMLAVPALQPSQVIEHNNARVMRVNSPVPMGQMDFVDASSVATKAVVHIQAKESKQLAMQRQQDSRRRQRSPFDDFFGGDFFGGDFFGNNFHRPRSGSGSGVIISEDGYIATNNHVVGFADEIMVTLNDGRQLEATKIGTDPSSDLAVLKINSPERFTKLDFADSDQVQVGEWVLAVGNPFGYLTSTVTAGIVSAKGRDLDLIEGEKTIEEFIQTDAAVNPGNSGGALVNAEGKLVGINSAIATPTGVYAGYSFAIPANLANVIIKDIIENGDIERVNLGIEGWDVKDIREDFNLSERNGFYIDTVYKGSAASLGGLIPGDIVQEVNGETIYTLEDIKTKMKFNKVGDTVSLRIVRDGVKKTIKLKLRKSM